MSAYRGKCFYAKVTKGYIPKTAFDALSASINLVTLHLTKTGIFICEADKDVMTDARILWNVSWERPKFAAYRCTEPMVIAMKASYLQETLRSVKKKDSLTFMIGKNDKNHLGIVIEPAGATQDGPAARSETVWLSVKVIDEENRVMPEPPEKYLDSEGESHRAYGNPMVISAPDFQKIKKMSKMNVIKVQIQRSNFIKFSAGEETVRSEITFGSLEEHPESDYESDDDDGKEEVSYSEDEESESEEEDVDEEDVDEETDESSDEEEEIEYPGLYEKNFAASFFVPLLKLPGLTTQMEFYAPKVDGFPLKISMSASSGLGDISVFIKDDELMSAAKEEKPRKK